MKNLISTLFLSAVLALAPIFAYPVKAQDQTVVKEIRKMTGSLKHLKGTTSFCSAVKLNPRIIITAAHCVELKSDTFEGAYHFVDSNGLTVYAEVFKKSDKADLALLKVPFVPGPYGELAKDFTTDEQVYAVGYPLNDFLGVQVVTSGYIQGFLKTNPTEIVTTSPIVFGNSGGGLYNAKGELVGITVGGIALGFGSTVGHLAFSVHVFAIQEFLK